MTTLLEGDLVDHNIAPLFAKIQDKDEKERTDLLEDYLKRNRVKNKRTLT